RRGRALCPQGGISGRPFHAAVGRRSRRRKPSERPRDHRRGRKRPGARAGCRDRRRDDHDRPLPCGVQTPQPPASPGLMSKAAFRVGVVLSPRPWSVRLHAFVADHVTDIEVVVVRDRRAALETSPHVLVIDDSTPWLTASFAADAERASITLVGVYDRT